MFVFSVPHSPFPIPHSPLPITHYPLPITYSQSRYSLKVSFVNYS
ncbi:hypothetical protein FDUTEX481_02513 [Tolypothrix sp. PCC 7601]|nr:hypothetical protein FDUTEX481_02513 [Tolypothrix sp. PCC 7601]